MLKMNYELGDVGLDRRQETGTQEKSDLQVHIQK